MTMIHKYKTIYPFFDDIWEGNKDFEVRDDDREATPQAGDIVYLYEWRDLWNPETRAAAEMLELRYVTAIVGKVWNLSSVFEGHLIAFSLKHIQCYDGQARSA